MLDALKWLKWRRSGISGACWKFSACGILVFSCFPLCQGSFFGFSHRFSSSLSLARSSDMYSSTVAHPAGDLSAIRINLFLFSSSSFICTIFFFTFLLDWSSSNSSALSALSQMDWLNSYYILLDLYLNSRFSSAFSFLWAISAASVESSLFSDKNFLSK